MTETRANATRWQRTPLLTSRFVAVLCVLAFAVMLVPLHHPWGVVIVGWAMLAIAFMDWLRSTKPAIIEVEREVPSLVTLRKEATVLWTVRNPTSRFQTIWFSDELAPSLNAGQRRFHLRVPPNGAAFAETKIMPDRRGLFPVNEIVVRTLGPLGLVARQARRQMPASIKVYPPFESRKQAELLIEKARVLEVGLRSVRGRGGGTEFEQLREYTIDDDIRRMDWAATIRTGKPIVRTYRAEQNQNVVVLLDCGRVMAGQVDGVARLEFAMDAVMALTTVATRLGDRVGMVAFDSEVRAEVAARHGNSQLARVTEAMYQLEPRLVESDYRRAFTHALSRFRRRSFVVLFTELSQQAVTELLAPAMSMITRQHVLLIASVSNPEIVSWANAVPVEVANAYRKAAAADSLATRTLTVAQLRARGARVVDGVPGRLAADVADAYLNVKATSRL